MTMLSSIVRQKVTMFREGLVAGPGDPGGGMVGSISKQLEFPVQIAVRIGIDYA